MLVLLLNATSLDHHVAVLASNALPETKLPLNDSGFTLAHALLNKN